MKPTVCIVAAALFSLAACGDVTSSGSGGGARPVGQVMVGNVYFRSAHNGSENPAVDTIAAGGSVTWTWDADGSHSIQSTRWSIAVDGTGGANGSRSSPGL
jgi:plastocyanin